MPSKNTIQLHFIVTDQTGKHNEVTSFYEHHFLASFSRQSVVDIPTHPPTHIVYQVPIPKAALLSPGRCKSLQVKHPSQDVITIIFFFTADHPGGLCRSFWCRENQGAERGWESRSEWWVYGAIWRTGHYHRWAQSHDLNQDNGNDVEGCHMSLDHCWDFLVTWLESIASQYNLYLKKW